LLPPFHLLLSWRRQMLIRSAARPLFMVQVLGLLKSSVKSLAIPTAAGGAIEGLDQMVVPIGTTVGEAIIAGTPLADGMGVTGAITAGDLIIGFGANATLAIGTIKLSRTGACWLHVSR
jgi:hypothetical protein